MEGAYLQYCWAVVPWDVSTRRRLRALYRAVRKCRPQGSGSQAEAPLELYLSPGLVSPTQRPARCPAVPRPDGFLHLIPPASPTPPWWLPMSSRAFVALSCLVFFFPQETALCH